MFVVMYDSLIYWLLDQLIRGRKLPNNIRNRGCTNRGFVQSWLEDKHVQVKHVERLIDNFVQVFISPQVAAIVHSNY